MYEILKRALDEALTQQYAAELSGAPEESHVFSPAFEKEIRLLIRKTDRSPMKVVRIFSAAACAVLVVGCALLLPRLGQNAVPTESEDAVSSSETDPFYETSSAEAAEENALEKEDAAEIEEDAQTPDADLDPLPATLKEPKPETEAEPPVPATSDGGMHTDNSGTMGEPSEIVTAEPASGEEDADENIEEDLEEADEDLEEDLEEADEDLEEDLEEADEDSLTETGDSATGGISNAVGEDPEDQDDCDTDDADNLPDEIIDDSDDEAPPEWPSSPDLPVLETLGAQVREMIGCSIGESWLHAGTCFLGGETVLPVMEEIPPEVYRDEALAALLETAERAEAPQKPGEKLLSVTVGSQPPVYARPYEYDWSARNRYPYLFGGEEDIADEEDVEDDEYQDGAECTLDFYTDGRIEARQQDYSGAAWYRMSGEALAKLNERLAPLAVAEIRTVGDLLPTLGASSGDYARISMQVSGYYDITARGALTDGTFLEEMLKKYEKEPLRQLSEEKAQIVFQRRAFVIQVCSRSTLKSLNLFISADGTAMTKEHLSFWIGEEDLRALLTEFCTQKKLAPPDFYKTLDDYLTGKNCTQIQSCRLHTDGTPLKLSRESGKDRERLDRLLSMLLEKADECFYLPVRETEADSDRCVLEVTGWRETLTISQTEIRIGENRFGTPEGLYGDLCALIREDR